VTALTATGQILAGRYELARFLAGGSMGEVWLANDKRMQRTVAVKVLRPEYARDPTAVERFRTEARLAARLAHPGIARVHDVDDGVAADVPPWIVQEYVPGKPLSELLAAGGRLEPRRVADLVAQAAEAVHAAHEAGVVHRDLTPGNLLVTADGVVKITDFGIARAAGQVPLTATGHVLGAAAYLSPEQVQGRPASPASDVYTLGVVLHECLAGSRPFTGATLIDVARAHLEQEPPPLPSTVPDGLRIVTVAAMAKDPADRPSSAAELAAHLWAVVHDLDSALAGGSPAGVEPPQAPSAMADPSNARPASGETRPIPHVHRAARATRDPAIPAQRDAARGAQGAPTGVANSAPARVSGQTTGAAAARDAAKTAVTPSSATLTGAQDLWTDWWPQVVHLGRDAWRRYPISRAGLAGIVVLVLVIVAVVSGAPDAAGAPAPHTGGPEAGTVRVDDDPGKGKG